MQLKELIFAGQKARSACRKADGVGLEAGASRLGRLIWLHLHTVYMDVVMDVPSSVFMEIDVKMNVYIVQQT